MTTETVNAPSPLGILLLSWLLTRHKGEGTRSGLGGGLQSILAQRFSKAEQGRTLDEEIAKLDGSGLLARPRRGALKLTRRGKAAVLAAFGVASLPDDIAWAALRKRYLCALALGVDSFPGPASGARADDSDRLRAALLQRHHRLALGKAPTLNQVRDALAWRAISVETAAKFQANAVMEVLLNRMLGASKPLPLKKVLEQLVAKAAGAPTSHARTIEHAALRHLLSDNLPVGPVTPQPGGTPVPHGNGAPEPGPGKRASLPSDDTAFAACVIAAARATRTGRFGDNKVFISHVIGRLRGDGASIEDPEAFKARLVSAHQQGLLSLSRADLVEAMDPNDVDASEARYRNATFHFVRI